MTLTLLAALAVMLAACSATAASSSTDATGSQTVAGTPNAAGTPVPSNASLSGLTRLLIGTLKLEDTDLAVTPDQAKTLLPLWQAVRSLSNSDTTAAAEMTAVEAQIQETLTTEQMDQINAMQLTRADLQTLAGELGISFGGGNRANATGTPGAGGFSGGGFPGGGAPPGGGGPPDGGGPLDGGAPPGGNLTAEQQATLEASRASRPNVGVPTQFLDALIQLLEAKAQ
jgi:hypothetical protein